jgi:hypothetical protein
MAPEQLSQYVTDEARRYAAQTHEGARLIASVLLQTARLVRITHAESAEMLLDRADALSVRVAR